MSEYEEPEYDVYTSKSGGVDCIKVNLGGALDGLTVEFDIRDAVYFRYLLDGAISDYERAAQ